MGLKRKKKKKKCTLGLQRADMMAAVYVSPKMMTELLQEDVTVLESTVKAD